MTTGSALLRRNRLVCAAALLLGLALLPGLALATHPEASLAPSNFEIDNDANLKQDDNAPSVDWATLAHPTDRTGPELRAIDEPTGSNDDSYRGGVKEDTACPGETTGSIPNNKSDLLTFHVYQEPGTGSHPGFLDLAWSRVSDPSGTTLLDFEFNQSETSCAVGPNVVRTPGDLLIEYAITQGGAQAAITSRTWSGSAWGPVVSLTAPSVTCGGNPCAAGTINTTAIPVADSDGLGAKQPRTFGEAQIDLRLVFSPDTCTSFGTAMLKSRSSDAFNSQLKDFISPIGIDLQNCAAVVIRKQTDPDEPDNTTQFGYTKSFATYPETLPNFQLTDDGVKNYGQTVLLGTGYTVDETNLAGYDFQGVDCSASVGVAPEIDGTLVTFDLDDPGDTLDCTYTNEARGSLVIEKVTTTGQGGFDFTSQSLNPSSWTLTTTAAGTPGKATRTFGNLPPDTYDAAETVPAGWNLTSATCDDGSAVGAISVSAGETVTCTFTNDRERGAIKIVKTRKHAATGSDDYPHAGVTFTITGGNLPQGGMTAVTDANGIACVDGLLISQFAGTYTVTETVPTGYAVVSANPQASIAVTESACANGADGASVVEFENMPLTNISVSVDSQVVGGTASVVSCDWDGNGSTESVTNTGVGGDVTVTRNNLQPGTYTCEVYVDP